MKKKLIIIIVVISLILIGLGIFYIFKSSHGLNKFTSDKAITLIKKENPNVMKITKSKEDDNLYYFTGYDKNNKRIDYAVNKKTKEVKSYTYIGEVDFSDSIIQP